MKEQGQEKDIKQQATASQKFLSKVYFIFCGDDELDKVINRSIVFNTYQQIIQIVHFILLYTWFGKTNNSTSNIVQTILSGFLILICLIPRIMSKYYAFLLTLICFTLISLASGAIAALLIINYYTFQNYCSILNNYSSQNSSFNFKANEMCVQVTNLYHLQLAFEGCNTLIRSVYIIFVLKAYGVSLKKYNEEQMKRRRQEKFDENMKNKSLFNINRKI